MFAIVHRPSAMMMVLLGMSCLLLSAPFLPVHAAPASVNRIAEAVPAQIPEMITGGSWRKGNVGGFYRAMVVIPEHSLSSGKDNSAEVVLQWIGREDGKPGARIFKTMRIKEVGEKGLKHAFLSMDTLKDNEMTLLVTSYDTARSKDISISVKATLPGKYRPGK